MQGKTLLVNYFHFTKKYFILIILMLSSHIISSHKNDLYLSDSAKIYLITCNAESQNIFTMFGHSALRVYDPILKIDYAYFYGEIDSDNNSLVLNLIQNKLTSNFKIVPYNLFKLNYTFFEREIIEQQILFNREQKQEIFILLNLTVNRNNREYQYLYFKNNCTTKLFDLINVVAPYSNPKYIAENNTYRKSISAYLTSNLGLKFLLDLCLGIPADRPLKSGDEIFLPFALKEYLESRNLVKPLHIKSTQSQSDLHAILLTLMISLGFFFLTILEYNRKKCFHFLNRFIFLITGLCGIFIMICWLVYDHMEMGWNLNLLWLSPTNLFLVFITPKKNYLRIMCCVLIILLIFWPILPQEMNLASLPLLFSLAVRYLVVSKII